MKDLLTLPLIVSLHRETDAVFPHTLVRAATAIDAFQRRLGGRHRTRPTRAMLHHLEGLENDAQFRQYLLERAKLGEVMQMFYAATALVNLIAMKGTDSQVYVDVKRLLKKDCIALALCREGLRRMSLGDMMKK